MTDSLDSPLDPTVIGAGIDSPELPSDAISHLGSLLGEMHADLDIDANADVADRLTSARLGIASSLYVALRCKSLRTAAHSLRVSLIASGWSTYLKLSDGHREAIEVAALLHDVGIIGLPDEILRKPGPLDPDETQLVESARKMSAEILRSACAERRVLEIVEHIPAWFDGSRNGYHRRGEELPLGARLVSIVEAFDSMTTEQVYRSAMPLERAGIELFRFAGTQFDPKLVNAFVDFHSGNLARIQESVAGRWLRNLAPEISNSYWSMTDSSAQTRIQQDLCFFEDRLLDNMHDAVVFVDASMRILRWNHGAERLTGIAGASVCDRRWSPNLLSIRGESGDSVGESDCPVNNAIASGVQSLRRLTISGRSRDRVAVDSHTIPVVDPNGSILGAVLVMHDASPETSLEERCQSLHDKATRDPLTQVANRAEFDRVFELFIETHRQQQVPCSLIICDLDLFKQINDTYGHQAGDEAIKSLAKLLKSSCRPGDLVARYGGEEFVMLCAHCDNAAAARRAEEIRKRLGHTPHPALKGRSITASFGVTEIQPGDNAETMLRRADRGLLIAKEEGRNTVVQLGAGFAGTDARDTPVVWGQASTGTQWCLGSEMSTPMPLAIVREKLAGFVADHQAKIVAENDSSVSMSLKCGGPHRRRSDRAVSLMIDLCFSRNTQDVGKRHANLQVSRTVITVQIHPHRNRDRRRSGVEDAAREVIASLRSYLGAQEHELPEAPQPAPAGNLGILGSVARKLLPWRRNGDR